MPYLGILKLGFEKTYFCHISHPRIRIFKNAKFSAIQIWDKNFLILVFLGCNFENLLLYLKSALSN